MKTIAVAALSLSIGIAAAGASPQTPHTLDTADVNVWLDGFLPSALSSGQIAGAVVVVVKDGGILTERGFGLADVGEKRAVDPERTLFRPGSVSKLFTWTAVMQLVEAGKLDLDRDIDTYLDFPVSSASADPITLRHLMTHTAGFEETYKGLIAHAPRTPAVLGDVLKAWVPTRIFAPGRVPAYSNYGAGLAGYIVERVSGEPFAQYVERQILNPLGMTRSTFVQPLPAGLARDMSRGYILASGPPKPYEIINLPPAGALAATGADMGRFMLAHLGNGALGETRILRTATAERMHATAFAAVPSLPGMALGFYHEDRNGQNIIGHRGNSEQFHSDLHLFLDRGVGLFISMNSAGNDSAIPLRDRLLDEFTDRYFPAPPVVPAPVLATARAHGVLIAGHYLTSRRAADTFLSVANLFDQKVVESESDGTLATTLDRTATRWREVAPFLWREVNGRKRLAAIVRDNSVIAFQTDDRPPVAVFQRVPAWLDAGRNVPLLLSTLAVIAVSALAWPAGALLRRVTRRRLEISGSRLRLFRFVRFTVLADLLFCIGWAILLGIVTSDVTAMSSALDPWIRLVQLFGLIGVVGCPAALVNAAVVWGDRAASWWKRFSATLVAIACIAVVWFALLLHLITPGLNY